MRGAAEMFVEQVRRTVPVRGRFSVALAGGNTPKGTYELLAGEPYRSSIDWDRVHVFWGDERCVPPDNARSNYRMTRTALLDRVPIPAGNVHRIRGELRPADGQGTMKPCWPGISARSRSALIWCFSAWARTDTRRRCFRDAGNSRADVPRSRGVRVRAGHVACNAYGTRAQRGGACCLLVSEQTRRTFCARSSAGRASRTACRAQLVQPAASETRWLIDRAAASRLPASLPQLVAWTVKPKAWRFKQTYFFPD